MDTFMPWPAFALCVWQASFTSNSYGLRMRLATVASFSGVTLRSSSIPRSSISSSSR
jgi:hypothetical protein